MADEKPIDDLKTLRGLLLQLDYRLQMVEREGKARWESAEARLQAVEAHHQDYMQSVGALRLHFDGKFEQVTLTMADTRTVVMRLNTLLREDDEGMSLLARQRMTDMWIKEHVSEHAQHQERVWRISSDVLTKCALWLLLGLVVVIAARIGLKS